ncbi:protease inhibitor I42 family protein [Kitasatospora sp. NPDC127111]|uniref:protease inhibitor I42 family protein n=1 Tax=Kitasatospora sp. NPDC127111 TaxID=3345363 RepID=UPI003634380C
MTGRTTRTRRTRTSLRAVVLAAVLAGGLTACGQDAPGRGRVLGAEERSVTVKPGERFSIPVRDNASVGDRWSLVDPRPDAAVVAEVDEVLDTPDGAEDADGAGGTRYYVFEAKGGGTTTITLFNCFRSLCDNPKTSDQNRTLLVRNTYTVTVR